MHSRSLIPKQPFRDQFFKIESVFGLKGAASLSREQVDDHYVATSKDNAFDLRLFFAWKVLRDPYYKTLVPKLKSFDVLYDAGFFLDALEPSEVVDLDFCPGECRTPIYQVAKNLQKLDRVERPVVLLCTGGFSPIHNGHIGMMHKAREVLEEQGYQVLGGYFSPSHDEYVSKKYNGEAALSAAHRIYLAQMSVAGSDWLFVDPWESRYLPTDVNFTDVAGRLEAYLNFYLKPSKPIEVAYVFGADNAGFSRAFVHKGLSVCVARSNEANKPVDVVRRACNKDRNLFVKSSNILSEISSSSVRKWKTGLIPEAITRQYFGWRLNMLRDGEGVEPVKKLYVLRDDSEWALKPWQTRVSKESLRHASRQFLSDLEQLIEQSFQDVTLPDRPQNIDVAIYSVAEQQAHVNALSKKERLLNLDGCTNEKHSGAIQISRLFALCNGQVRPEQVVPRPGHKSIADQMSRLKPGDYTLVDDDIASGNTMSLLMALLPDNVHVKKIRTLTEHSHREYLKGRPKSANAELFDMVDLRDFIFGAKAGGLVVELPNRTLARAPYSLPYISLTTRASLPPSAEMAFSKAIWKLNHAFFQSLNKPILIKQTDPYFQAFCTYLKFPLTMSMTEFCEWHSEHLFKYI